MQTRVQGAVEGLLEYCEVEAEQVAECANEVEAAEAEVPPGKHRGQEEPHSPAPGAGQEGPHSQHPEDGPLGVQEVDLEYSAAREAQPKSSPSVPAYDRPAQLLIHAQRRKHAAPFGERRTSPTDLFERSRAQRRTAQ